MQSIFRLLLLVFLLQACGNADQSNSTEAETPKLAPLNITKPTIGTIERIDPSIDQLIRKDAVIEVLGKGYTWSEGPVWLPKQKWLLFSDVPENKIYRWQEGAEVELYLTPSGFTGEETDSREPGSNGLTLDAAGNLVLCQHGDRRVARYTGDLDNPTPSFETVVDRFEEKRFNSPNDLIYDSQGNLYFTDPPYGLSPAMMDDPKKELSFQGVYRLSKSGDLTLISKNMSRPNGIGISPDDQKLYVANSDPNKALWMEFTLSEDGQVESERVFYDATDRVKQEKGLPDGLKVDRKGNIWATGPGGVWIFTADAKLLGRVKPGDWGSANCGFDTDQQTLFITSNDHLVRVQL